MLIPSPIIFYGHDPFPLNFHPHNLPSPRTVLVFTDLSLHVGSLLMLIQCLGMPDANGFLVHLLIPKLAIP